MVLHVSNQPVPTDVQASLKSECASLDRTQGTQYELSRLVALQQLVLAGERLIEALRLEREVGQNPMQPDQRSLNRLRACRDSVERFAREYRWSLAKWQETVSDEEFKCCQPRVPDSISPGVRDLH